MRLSFFSVIALLLLISSPAVLAVKVSSIYQAKVPVASRSAQEKTTALQAGLKQVLIKVSGDSQLLENNPLLQAKLSHVDELVQDYSYAAPEATQTAMPYLLVIHFDPEGVNRILRETGKPSWGQNRPLILVWLALETPNHPVDIVDSSTGEIQALLKAGADERGLPMILPVMDMTDLNQVSVKDVLANSVQSLQQAAHRYAGNAILIGHVKQTNLKTVSQWQLVMGAEQWHFDVTGKDLQEVLSVMTNHVADVLVKRYSAVTTDAVQSEVALKIVGVKQQSDLMELIKYLQHLSPVADVQLVSVTGQEIVLNISLRGSKDSFVQALALGKNLQPVTANVSQENLLQYQWVQ